MIKKILSSVTVLLLLLVLVACNNTPDGLVISKLYTASTQSNNIIELYNNSDKDLKLDKYTIDIYGNGAKEISETISLSGTIKANDYFVIAGNNVDTSLVTETIDVTYDANLPFNGNDAIQLSKGKNAIDVVGIIGFDLDFSINSTLIRLGEKEDYIAQVEYERYNFINYVPDLFEYLRNDNHEIKTLNDLLSGPMLEQRYKDMPFLDPQNASMGFGGTVKVDSYSPGDGDTSFFTTSEVEGIDGSFRYYYIDTPEVDGPHVSAEPWGYVASKYNKEYKLPGSSQDVYLQSIPGISTTDTHDRGLGLVWINDYLAQFLVVSEGLSTPVSASLSRTDIQLAYKNVPYLTFMQFAEQRARENGWGMYGFPMKEDGEKSPDWNYQANRNTTTDPQWTPHLPMPWDNE